MEIISQNTGDFQNNSPKIFSAQEVISAIDAMPEPNLMEVLFSQIFARILNCPMLAIPSNHQRIDAILKSQPPSQLSEYKID